MVVKRKAIIALVALLVIWLALVLLGLLYAGLFSGLLLLVPASAVVAVFMVQQALNLLGAWLKLLRLAMAIELARDGPAPHARGPVNASS